MNQIRVLMEEPVVHMASTLILAIVHLVTREEIVKVVSRLKCFIFKNYLYVLIGDSCIPNPCQNGGLCRPNTAAGTYVCDCPSNFIGQNCETSKLFLT